MKEWDIYGNGIMENRALTKSLKTAPLIFILLSICFFPFQLIAAPKTKVPVTLGNGETRKVSCSLKGKRWRRSKRRQAKSNGSRSTGKAFKKNANQACKSLIPPKTVGGLEKIPTLSNVVKENLKGLNRSIALAQRGWGVRAVSGTPPTLAEFPDQDIPNLFWREGVVSNIANGTASPEDCNEFFGGNNDGDSAGLAGCFMAQETARSVENLLQSAASLCFMKAIPELGSGSDGLTVLSGGENIPNGDFTKIFSTPKGGTSRTVEIRLTGFGEGFNEEGPDENGIVERLFIRPYNQKRVKRERKQYGHEIYFCAPNDDRLRAYELTTIGREGKVLIENSGSNNGELYENTVTGYLSQEKVDGERQVTFNAQLPRTLDIAFQENESNFIQKALIDITADNQIFSKTYSLETIDAVNLARRGYSIVRFSGANAGEARFFEGAFKDEKDDQPGEGFQVGVEFRGDRFLAAPGSAFVELLDQVNLLTDEFYSVPELSFDSSQFDCGVEADVVILMDFSTTTLSELSQVCNAEALQDQDYCNSNSLIRQAEQNYSDSCRRDGV